MLSFLKVYCSVHKTLLESETMMDGSVTLEVKTCTLCVGEAELKGSRDALKVFKKACEKDPK